MEAFNAIAASLIRKEYSETWHGMQDYFDMTYAWHFESKFTDLLGFHYGFVAYLF
jgi:hypothetical protein